MQLLDCHPVTTDMRAEILAGLARQPRHLPSKYFYDAHGARLFEAICELPEYYPTRTEIGILEQALPQIAVDLGRGRWIIEPGSGSGIKTWLLLQALRSPRAYVPIDISKAQLRAYGEKLNTDFPALDVQAVCADFTQDLSLPPALQAPVIWFPGSTIGNFHPNDAQAFLQRLGRWGNGGADLLIGVDLYKDIAVLEAAYNDRQGITAQFNLNLLAHINRALGCTIPLDGFTHQARWNPAIGAIQMFLHSRHAQCLHIQGQRIELQQDEPICTEYSYKYRPEQFEELARAAGWRLHRSYTDARQWFALFHLRRV